MVTRYNIWQGGGKTTLVPADGGALVTASDYDAALDALQEMCRRDCSFKPGYYDAEGDKTLFYALDVLVAAGRLVWIHGDRVSAKCIAKDKEA